MKKVFIIAIIIIIIGGIFVFLSWRGKNNLSLVTNQTNFTNNSGNSADETNNELQNSEPDPLTKLKNELTLFSRTFIERYGTWSNQSNFENFNDLYPYMTDKLKIGTQTMVGQKMADFNVNNSYYGVTTKILSLEINDFNQDARTEFSAKVQQQESKDNVNNIFYKTVKLVLIKNGPDWQADEITFSP